MDILTKIPAMPDEALRNLCANAERLAQTGSRQQRSQAADLIPALKAELQVRQVAKLERTAQARRDASALRAQQREAAQAEAPAA